MLNSLRQSIDRFRGELRIGKTVPRLQGAAAPGLLTTGNQASDTEPSWLAYARILIPGEALAGYISLQSLEKLATHPENVQIFLALAFCCVTIVLRWIGTQDPNAADPRKTVDYAVVVISTLSYISLVYATGGQIFWHQPVVDQQLYAQIISCVLGILGPKIHAACAKT